jgi:hypothetical protein
MSMPTAGDLAQIALPDDHGSTHRLADQRGRWTIITLSETTRRAAPPRLASSRPDEEVRDTGPTPGASAPMVREPPPLPRSRPAPHALPGRGPRRGHRPRWWTLKSNYGREQGIQRRLPVDPDGRIARMAEGQGRRAHGRRPAAPPRLREPRASPPERPSACRATGLDSETSLVGGTGEVRHCTTR